METHRSLASGWSGGLPGTGRPSASFSADGGRLFAREVERAQTARAGTDVEERRLEELEDARRSSRREGFGAEEDTPRAEREVEARSDAGAELAARAAPNRVAPPQCEPDSGAEPAPTSSSPAPTSGEARPAPAAAPEAPAPPAASALPAVSAAPVALAAHAAEVAPTSVAPPPATEATPAAPPAAPKGSDAPRAAQVEEPASTPGAQQSARAEEILRQIDLHFTPGVKRLTLELEPLELGRLAIQLALRSGKLAAIVRGERPETLELLRGRTAELNKLLAERGIEADEVRFELGFRSSRTPRREARTGASDPFQSGHARGGPSLFDTYA